MCESGSGTPKANGTQECSCSEVAKANLIAKNQSELGLLIVGYRSNKFGSINPDNYRGHKITQFTTLFRKTTSLVFENYSGIHETLKIKINGTTYDFMKTTSTDEDTGEVLVSWHCKEKYLKKIKPIRLNF